MSYSAPAGNDINFQLLGAYVAPVGNNVLLSFSMGGEVTDALSFYENQSLSISGNLLSVGNLSFVENETINLILSKSIYGHLSFTETDNIIIDNKINIYGNLYFTENEVILINNGNSVYGNLSFNETDTLEIDNNTIKWTDNTMTVLLAAIFNGTQMLTDDGVPLSGGKIYTYQARTFIPKVTYADATGQIENDNPIILNSSGRPTDDLWVLADTLYKFVLRDSNNILVREYDDVPGIFAEIMSDTSIGLQMPAEFTVSGSPAEDGGNLAVDWAPRGAAQVLATPTNASGKPTFRNLTSSDVPVVTIDAILPSQTGHIGAYLTTNGVNTSWSTVVTGLSLSAISAATTGANIANGTNNIVWNWQLNADNNTGLWIGESVPSIGGAGTQDLLRLTTGVGSTANALRIISGGVSSFRIDSKQNTFASERSGNMTYNTTDGFLFIPVYDGISPLNGALPPSGWHAGMAAFVIDSNSVMWAYMAGFGGSGGAGWVKLSYVPPPEPSSP